MGACFLRLSHKVIERLQKELVTLPVMMVQGAGGGHSAEGHSAEGAGEPANGAGRGRISSTGACKRAGARAHHLQRQPRPLPAGAPVLCVPLQAVRPARRAHACLLPRDDAHRV